MAYQVDRYNGTFLVSVEDGTIDTTTDLRFLGKNYAGYGEVQNENFLHLLENFANTSAPPRAVLGQVWYDSANKKIKFYDGSRFRTAGGSEVSATAPSGLVAGDFWLDTTTDQLYVSNGTSFVLVGPQISEDLGATAVEVVVVKDVSNVNHTIIKFNVGSDTQYITSKTAFTLNATVNPITGFSEIKKGLTLINTPSTGVTTDDHWYWGTASNTAKLGGFAASEYLRNTNALFPNGAKFYDVGYTLGDSEDVKIFVEDGDSPIISNQLGSSGSQKITVRIVTSGGDRDYVFGADAFYPAANNARNLGDTAAKWATVYATTFNGALTGNVTGNVAGNVTGNVAGTLTGNLTGNVLSSTGITALNAGSTAGTAVFVGSVNGTASNALQLNSKTQDAAATADTIALRDGSGNLVANQFTGTATQANTLLWNGSYRTAASTSTANTVVIRDASSNIYCNVLNGTATSAQYADLAEKYLTDQEYDTGTVVVVGGEKEVTASTWGKRAIGVVSANPAFMMNRDLEGGTYIALKGRVPVKIIGSVKKGDNLIAANDGCASVAVHHSSEVFAVALESNNDTSVKLVEAIIL
jgi:hypothetical protein